MNIYMTVNSSSVCVAFNCRIVEEHCVNVGAKVGSLPATYSNREAFNVGHILGIIPKYRAKLYTSNNCQCEFLYATSFWEYVLTSSCEILSRLSGVYN